MFTIHQVKAAHAKVKSGADFPAYVQDIIQLGVTKYESYVTDGHVQFYGSGGFTIPSDAKYPALAIADKSNKDQFLRDLKEHQQGKTDYLTFCRMCADLGIEKWIVDTQQMTCTYYDKHESEILIETIPTV